MVFNFVSAKKGGGRLTVGVDPGNAQTVHSLFNNPVRRSLVFLFLVYCYCFSQLQGELVDIITYKKKLIFFVALTLDT
jgi:hypothetical protein